MKKFFAVMLAVISLTMLLTSCASNAPMSRGDGAAYDPMPSSSPGSASNPEAPASGGSVTSGSTSSTGGGAGNNTGSSGGIIPITPPETDGGLADKIIYTVTAEIETLTFDTTIQDIYDLLAFNKAFVENAYVGGRNIEQSKYPSQLLRKATFTLRVPKDRLNSVTASLDGLGNVTSLRSGAENITANFYDTQSRLNSYKTQEERLLEMLGKAETIEDMLDIEDRLAGIRYQIESLTTSLRNWQNQVDYSTLNIYVSEVIEYTEPEPEPEPEPEVELTYWQQIWVGLAASAVSVAHFFMGLFKWIVVNLPVLAILAAIAILVTVLVKRIIKRSATANQKATDLRMSQNDAYGYGAAYLQHTAPNVGVDTAPQAPSGTASVGIPPAPHGTQGTQAPQAPNDAKPPQDTLE